MDQCLAESCQKLFVESFRSREGKELYTSISKELKLNAHLPSGRERMELLTRGYKTSGGRAQAPRGRDSHLSGSWKQS